MKTKIAAALSLTGVLVAGSAAALVNTQVLQRNDDASGTLDAVAASVTSTTAPIAAITATTTTIPGTGAPTTVPGEVSSTTIGASPSTSSEPSVPVTSAPAPGGATTQAVYRIGDAGTVTLDTAGDRLVVVTATPGAGWQVWKVEQEGPLGVEVKFRSATTEVEFRANLLFGVVDTSVETELIGAPPAGGGTSTTTPGGGSTPPTTTPGGGSIPPTTTPGGSVPVSTIVDDGGVDDGGDDDGGDDHGGDDHGGDDHGGDDKHDDGHDEDDD